jgi:hypothetical protein
MLAKGKNYRANIKSIFFMNFLPEKKYGVPSHNFVKKNVLCEKGDEITRFDGTLYSSETLTYYKLASVNFLWAETTSELWDCVRGNVNLNVKPFVNQLFLGSNLLPSKVLSICLFYIKLTILQLLYLVFAQFSCIAESIPLMAWPSESIINFFKRSRGQIIRRRKKPAPLYINQYSLADSFKPVAKFIVRDWGDKVNPMPELTKSSSQGL